MIPALLLTLAVEVPLWTAALVTLRQARWPRAVLLGALVNVVTHPVLWWSLAPRPSTAAFVLAELAVVLAETALVFAVVRRDPALLLVTGAGANAASIAAGLLIL